MERRNTVCLVFSKLGEHIEVVRFDTVQRIVRSPVNGGRRMRMARQPSCDIPDGQRPPGREYLAVANGCDRLGDLRIASHNRGVPDENFRLC